MCSFSQDLPPVHSPPRGDDPDAALALIWGFHLRVVVVFRSYDREALLVIALAFALVGRAAVAAAHWTLIGWNNLGMHCIDSDYSVFSVLPPYNTVNS